MMAKKKFEFIITVLFCSVLFAFIYMYTYTHITYI